MVYWIQKTDKPKERKINNVYVYRRTLTCIVVKAVLCVVKNIISSDIFLIQGIEQNNMNQVISFISSSGCQSNYALCVIHQEK